MARRQAPVSAGCAASAPSAELSEFLAELERAEEAALHVRHARKMMGRLGITLPLSGGAMFLALSQAAPAAASLSATALGAAGACFLGAWTLTAARQRDRDRTVHQLEAALRARSDRFRE